ncbi:hypothetical protein [Saccharicrinis fermentans]|uniref:Outer membrane protein beta-barrel domain-containing protein n=1 Tax=Saccharicrinis fermentans DSM 9555 = JCM 21142 TaxID=869213 RepID=W7YD91_9BACT|nr:hypothetical protein [Saccharicrinis fermentans]GAF02446.1 hypothetical protein JCM21142_31081 [Saccharicrinis fermentans DSM 9555 = JCM 21142]
MFFCSVVNSQGQENNLENNLFGIQIGIYPLSVYNEYRINRALVLRSELGFSYAWVGGTGIDGSDQWALTPDVVLEPRLYYNINRRISKEKRIDGNSGNYLAVHLGYRIGELAIRSKNITVFPSFSVLPMYGLRRNLGKHFNFEFAFGIGHSWTFQEFDYVDYMTSETETYKGTNSELVYGLRLAFGFIF